MTNPARSPAEHPEFQRAERLIADALEAMHGEAGDVRSFASCLLSQATALYRLVHGAEGHDGAPAVLRRLAEAEADRAAASRLAEATPQGRA